MISIAASGEGSLVWRELGTNEATDKDRLKLQRHEQPRETSEAAAIIESGEGLIVTRQLSTAKSKKSSGSCHSERNLKNREHTVRERVSREDW